MKKVIIFFFSLIIGNPLSSQNPLFSNYYSELDLKPTGINELKNLRKVCNLNTEKKMLMRINRHFINNNKFQFLSDTTLLRKLFCNEIQQIAYKKTGHVATYTATFYITYKQRKREGTFELYFFDSVLIRKSFKLILPTYQDNFNLNHTYVKSLKSFFNNSFFKFNPNINTTSFDTLFISKIETLQKLNSNLSIKITDCKLYPTLNDYIEFTYSKFDYSLERYSPVFKDLIDNCNLNILMQLIHSPNLCISTEAKELTNYLAHDISLINSRCGNSNILFLKTMDERISSNVLGEWHLINTQINDITTGKIVYPNYGLGQSQKQLSNTLYEK